MSLAPASGTRAAGPASLAPVPAVSDQAQAVRGAKVRLHNVVPEDRCLPKGVNLLRPAPAKGPWGRAVPVGLVQAVPVLVQALVVLARVRVVLVSILAVLPKAAPSAGRTADLPASAPIGRSSNGKILRCTPC